LPICALLPTLVADARRAPEDIIGINPTLDVEQPVVVVAPKNALVVWLIAGSLSCHVNKTSYDIESLAGVVSAHLVDIRPEAWVERIQRLPIPIGLGGDL
jgi:hypothetical protein